MFNIIATFHEPRAFTAAEREQREIETTELSNGHTENNNNKIDIAKEEKIDDFKYIQVTRRFFISNRSFCKNRISVHFCVKIAYFV